MTQAIVTFTLSAEQTEVAIGPVPDSLVITLIGAVSGAHASVTVPLTGPLTASFANPVADTYTATAQLVGGGLNIGPLLTTQPATYTPAPTTMPVNLPSAGTIAFE